MRRKLAIGALAAALVAGVIWWIGSAFVGRTYERRAQAEWPLGLGTLDSVPARYQKVAQASALARDVAKLEGSDIARDFVREHVQRTNDAIDELPADLVRAVREIAPIRDRLLHGERLVWPVDVARGDTAPLPDLRASFRLHRLLLVGALARARAGDPAAWDDLRAAWQLERELFARPELVSVLVALGMARAANGIARKMPLPVPAWFAETRAFDYRRAFVAAWQAETWRVSTVTRESWWEADGTTGAVRELRRAGSVAVSPYVRYSAADLVERMRRVAIDVAQTRHCDVGQVNVLHDIPAWNLLGRVAMPNVGDSFRRVVRFDVEREVTDRILAMKRGDPPRPQSGCADGQWIYEGAAIRFSRTLPPGLSDVPLDYTVTLAPATRQST